MTTLRRKPTPTHRPALPGDVRWTLAIARALTVLGIGLLVAAAVAWAIHRPMFNLRAIEVRGDVQRVAASHLRSAALPQLRGNFFSLNLRQAAAAFESVPWVRHAVVQRVWPNRLRVTLEEHQVAAIWTSDDSTRLVNRQGEVFEANVGAVDDEGLPQLDGPAGSAARVLAFHQALDPVFARLNTSIGRLSLSGRGSWTVTLDSDAVIEIGRGDERQLIERSARFVRSLPDLMQRYPRPLLHADLRHREGYALRLAGLTTEAPARPAATRTPNRSPQPARAADTNR
jgi:cell division protein FtsQ